MRIPAWTREELILALELYHRFDIEWLRKLTGNSPEMVELSNTLRNISIHSRDYRLIESFRSPSSVHMKLMNFLRCDTRYGKAGLSNGSKLEQNVWNEFKNNKDKLKQEAENILKKYSLADEVIKTEYAKDSNKDYLDTEKALLKKILTEIEQTINDINELYRFYNESRRKAAFIEPLEESQSRINIIYNKIVKIEELKSRLAEIQKEISCIKSDENQVLRTIEDIGQADKTGDEMKNKDIIKFTNKYSSIALGRELIVFILKTIKQIDADEICIETGKILEKVSDRIKQESNYKFPQHCLSNVIRFLLDSGVLVLYKGAKKGKYIIEDYEVIQKFIDYPELISELS